MPSYVPPEIWRNAPDSYDAPENKPNGASYQKYFFTKPWEAKHAIGVQHATRLKFQSREGISKISYNVERVGDTFGYFGIEGKPDAVDKVMEDLAILLQNCSSMHFLNYY